MINVKRRRNSPRCSGIPFLLNENSYLFQLPLVLIVSFALMWNTIGPSCLAGLAVIVVLVPFNAVLLIKHVRELQVETLFTIDTKYYTKLGNSRPTDGQGKGSMSYHFQTTSHHCQTPSCGQTGKMFNPSQYLLKFVVVYYKITAHDPPSVHNP